MQNRLTSWIAAIALAAGLAAGGGASADDPAIIPRAAVEKVIIDSDYNTMSDDGQLGTMAMQLQAAGKLSVLGITVVAGNDWVKQEVADALKSVERMGLDDKIGVYAGADASAEHCAFLEATVAAGGGSLSGGSGTVGTPYKGACELPAPTDATLVAPPDGFATRAKLQQKSAEDFIIETIKANPFQVTILSIGPQSNIANALKKAPEIGPLIKRIIFQGGNFEPPGPVNAFNAWFDYPAAHTVGHLPVPIVLIPRDVTNVTPLTKPIYDRIANAAKPTPVTQIFKQWYARTFADDAATTFVWDTLALAYLMDPTFATATMTQYIDFLEMPLKQAGFSQAYDVPPRPEVQKITWVKRFDNARFFDWYVDLLTRPVPVTSH